MQEPTISTKPIAENRSSYKSWVASEGIPIIQGFFIEDIRKVALEPWQRTGGLAARLCLEGTGETNDAYVCEIPAGRGAWLFLPPTGFTSISILAQNRCAI